MKLFEIWLEGYIATGESAQAHKVGEALGENFMEACYNFVRDTPNCEKRFGKFNPKNLSLWGCRMYPTEWEARSTYG